MNDLSGTQLGKYQLIRRIARGGMSDVYRARQVTTDRQVAVKVMRAVTDTEDEFRRLIRRFEQEARIVAGLRHPHILPMYDYGHERNLPYIAMKLVQGGTLGEVIREGALPAKDTGGWLYQIGSALDHAHQHGVIHRDLKPTNILLDGQGNAFLTDFGIAKLSNETSSFTVTGNVLGTPTYMAPEQWRSESLTSLTDVYGLGVLVYLMLTGHPPFEADTPHAMMYKHLNDPVPPLTKTGDEIPEAIQQVVRKALAKHPNNRYEKAGEFSNDFQRAIRGQDTLARREQKHLTAPAKLPEVDDLGKETKPKAPEPSIQQPIEEPAKRKAAPDPVYGPPEIYQKSQVGITPAVNPYAASNSKPIATVSPTNNRSRLTMIAASCAAIAVLFFGGIGAGVAFFGVDGDTANDYLPVSLFDDSDPSVTDTPEPTPRPTTIPGSAPTLSVNFPNNGSIFTIDSDVIINITATDTQGVTRIEMRRFGFVFDAITLDAPQTNFTDRFIYSPRHRGSHLLEIVPYRGDVRGDSTFLEIMAQ